MLHIGQEEIDAVSRVIKSGYLFRYGDRKAGHPNECARFEEELARKTGTQYALAVTSGTAAIICGLVGLGVGPGDEVILPGYTFMASALAPLAVGAIPVIAEIDESLTLDPKDAEAKITPRTRVIMPVHMCGLPCNMEAIMRVARRHNRLARAARPGAEVKVLEDACQADGGSYKGKRLGSIGELGAFSFNYYKNITSGEGGAIVTSDQVVHERALIHHDGGAIFRPHAKDIGVPFFAGWNFRLNEILGAVLRVQLKRVDGLLARTRARKKKMVAALEGMGLRSIRYHDLEGDCGTTVGLLFSSEREARAFIAALAKQGVGASTPIDSGRHVYSNWEPVMQRRGSYHPALDAFRRPENRGSQVKYTQDMCPRTLDILSRAVLLGVSPREKPADLRRRLQACRRAADEVG